MSLEGRIEDLATSVGGEIKTVRGEVTSGLAGKAPTSHTHDDRYYTEAEVNTLLAAKAPAAQTINAQSGTAYTLVAADAGKVVTRTSASTSTTTVPASVFSAGQRVDVIRTGTGSLTFVAGAGMTLNGTPSLVARAQWSAVSVLFLSATQAVLVGDMATP